MYGDPATVRLPNSGMTLTISTLWWQYSRHDDVRTRFPIGIPVAMTIGDYFAMGDPLLEAALETRGRKSIHQIAVEQGVDEAIAAFERRRAEHGHVDWWRGTHEDRINDLGYELLRSGEADKALQAVELFRINTVSHPSSWNAWDSYGDALERVGSNDEAAKAYAHALEAFPSNWNAPAQRAAVERLTGDSEWERRSRNPGQ